MSQIQNRTQLASKPTNTAITTTRHLTKAEWEDRRRWGLCFSCGQRYSPQHKCVENQLGVLLHADGEELTEEGEIHSIELGENIEIESVGECQVLEMCSMTTEKPSDN